MSIKYKIAFSVNILHDYYANGICPDFDLVPSAETVRLLTGHRMRWKSVGNKLIVLIGVDSSDIPIVSLSKATKLSFYLKLKNPHFNNFSNLSYAPSAPLRYYFSNINQTKIASDLYLTSKIANYSNASNYIIGSLASNAANDVYEAIRPSGPGNVHGLTQQAYWIKRGAFLYVNANDLIELSAYVYPFKTTPATDFLVHVYGFNPVSGHYDEEVMTPGTYHFSTAQSVLPIRLETLAAGKYRVEVNGESRMIYLDTTQTYQQIFGVLEIFNNLAPNNSFSLFTAGGIPKSPQFNLRFANRLVIWKYISRTSDVTAIEDLTSNSIFTEEGANQFISSKPIPLQEKPSTTLLLKSTALGDVSPLANPRSDQLGYLVRDGHTYFCSEIYLKY